MGKKKRKAAARPAPQVSVVRAAADGPGEQAQAAVVVDDAPRWRTEVVDGVEFQVRGDMTRSWAAVRAARDLRGGELDLDKVIAMVRLVEACTTLDEAAIVEHCGGAEASFADVISFVAGVVRAMFPKN